jgi:CRISPR-associated endonuclease Csn1
MLVNKPNEWEMNYSTIEGNRTNAVLYEAFIKMFEMEGHEFDFSKSSALKIQETISSFFSAFGISTDILHFNALLDGNSFDKQPAYEFGIFYIHTKVMIRQPEMKHYIDY